MIELVEQAGEPSDPRSAATSPICPHCSMETKKIFMREIKSRLGRRYLYYCSECLKVLGISHRKGFWMG